ncbi:MAG TPA: alpha/beta hydrolase [Chitinophagaceae bacterium]|nr:alpha/beta hydrolase [Chitinophagaceae bacterium]
MKKKVRWPLLMLKISGGLVIAFVLFCLVADQFVQFRLSDKELTSFFKENNIKGQIHYYNSHGRTMRYISMGNDSLPVLLFIHGSPASSSIYTDYYKDTSLSNHFKMFAVDRPGYGYSGFGKPEASIQKQADMIRPILDSLNKITRPVIVMAGSYGTSVACRLVMDHPKLVDGLVLIAPSVAPGKETIYSVSYAAAIPAINWFVPRMLQSANVEKLSHKEELSKMVPLWKEIKIPVMYLQGERDELIDTANASFARREMVNAPFLSIEFVKNEPHFIAYSARPLIKQKIVLMKELLLKTKQ